ncbi:MAG: tRNA 2-selenouridine(34) synthase MnmH [Sulfurospirillaceae bacterium]|nr:tRNA 2-selenouridine(34) synthase MnmH [Sulfurospirillaceae bacterium]
MHEITIEEFISQRESFDLVIDARSPSEFAESHIPNALNFYALSDTEHEEVGHMYKQISRVGAKVKGAQYICNNVSTHLNTIYPAYPLSSKIAIYCARGGLRSESIGVILSNIGYRIYKIKNGYKAYRQNVVDFFEKFEHNNFIVLGGNTGCGKSEILPFLPRYIDLEKTANHLGSAFGSIKGKQPSQKAFQNNLAEQLRNIKTDEPIFIEGESRRMGKIMLPSRLHEAMSRGFRIEIKAPLELRVKRIMKDYEKVDSAFFYTCIDLISTYIKKEAKESAIKAYESGDLEKVAEILLVDYYDVVYKKPKKIDLTIENISTKDTAKKLIQIYQDLSNTKPSGVSS